jgi:FtsZ-interacting cell division protein ZipA
MSTALIILIAIGVIVLLAALYMASRKRAEQRREDEREIARAHRREGEERAREAQMAEREAQAHFEQAEKVDPDARSEDANGSRELREEERHDLHAGERQPASDTEFARRNA